MGGGVPATPHAQQDWILIEILKYFCHLKAAWVRSSPRTMELEAVARNLFTHLWENKVF